MRRARGSSNFVGKGKKRCRSVESEPKARIKCSSSPTVNAPNYGFGSSLTAAARVMTRRMARELSVFTDFLEVKEEPSEQEIKIEEQVMAAAVVKVEPTEEENVNTAGSEAASSRGDGGAAAELGQHEMGFGDDELVMKNWNAWSFEQEEKAWWGSWYWDWAWYPYCDYTIRNDSINWVSSLHFNEELVWEVDIWNWDDANSTP